MTQSGKHGSFDGNPWNQLKIFTSNSSIYIYNSKFLGTAANGLSVVLFMFEDHWSEASPEMTYSGNTEHSAEFFEKF